MEVFETLSSNYDEAYKSIRDGPGVNSIINAQNTYFAIKNP
jgi:hypothetical protein